MSATLRQITDFLAFARWEFTNGSASAMEHVDALLRRKYIWQLNVLHPEVKRNRSYIPTTVFARWAGADSRRRNSFFFCKLTQKLWLDRYFPDHAPPVTHYFGPNGLVPAARSATFLPLDELPQLVRQLGGLFLKPPDSGQGRNAMRLTVVDDAIEANGMPIDDRALCELARERWQGCLVSEIIRNSAWTGRFSDCTLNTLRILTGIRRDTRTPMILAALLKIGNGSSSPTDNWRYGIGGLTAKIDRDTGRLGLALTFSADKPGERLEFRAHPQSGVMIEGQVVPDWPMVKHLALDLASRLPLVGLVGWDIALTPTGLIVVEGNITPSIAIHEAHESLLATDEQRACLAGLGIVLDRRLKRIAIC